MQDYCKDAAEGVRSVKTPGLGGKGGGMVRDRHRTERSLLEQILDCER